MKMFLDTADLVEIEKWLSRGILDGITTNPSILKKAGVTEPMAAWKEIIALINTNSDQSLSLSVEVFCDEPDKMLDQARGFVKELNYAGTTIKIPILGIDGADRLAVIRSLSQDGIAVNCTACVTWLQAFAAAKAGARYVSLLYRRMIDVGLDARYMISKTRELLGEHQLGAEIIIGSIRKAEDVFDAYEAGGHIVTIPTKFMPEILFHQKSVDTQEQFLRDAGVIQ
ncbi:MAG: transaldolase family protein [bacterium]|nr:transaldolase family protein [bacterium]